MYRWYKPDFKKNLSDPASIHWKFYMTDKELILSTQHPTKLFYPNNIEGKVNRNEESTLGYDISISNCPNILKSFDNLFNYYWRNHTQIPSFDKERQSKQFLPCLDSIGETCCNQIEGTTCSASCFGEEITPPEKTKKSMLLTILLLLLVAAIIAVVVFMFLKIEEDKNIYFYKFYYKNINQLVNFNLSNSFAALLLL